jgi:hypothetical protein
MIPARSRGGCMGTQVKSRSGDYIPKSTKREVLDFIRMFLLRHDHYPTVDDFTEKFHRSKKVMAEFLSRYARYGIIEAFKEQSKKTTYGPGPNWEKVDRLEWRDFFKAGKCQYCGHNGVLGFVGPKSIRYRCKWCRKEWRVDRDTVNKEIWDEIERQAQKTKQQWSHTSEQQASTV